MNFAANLLRNRQNLFIRRRSSYCKEETEIYAKCAAFLHIFFPHDTRIVHTLFTSNLGSLKESTLYFSHSLKQRATNKRFWGPLSTSPNGQSGRPRNAPQRGVTIKIKDQCKQTAPARVYSNLFSHRCCILHFELNSLRGLFQILPRPARAVCGWGGAAGRPFRTCRTLSSRTPCGPARCGPLHSSSPHSSRGGSAWCS